MDAPRESRIRMAMQAVGDGESCASACKKYDIPKSTLYDHMHKISKKFSKGRNCVFSEEEEKQFTEMLKTVAKKGYTLTSKHCRTAAYHCATIAGFKHNFDHKEKMAGRKWFNGYIKRNNIKIVTKKEEIQTSEESSPQPEDLSE